MPLEDVQDALNRADPRTTRHYDRTVSGSTGRPGYALAAYLAGH